MQILRASRQRIATFTLSLILQIANNEEEENISYIIGLFYRCARDSCVKSNTRYLKTEYLQTQVYEQVLLKDILTLEVGPL